MKILFLTNLLPYPLDNGGKIKTYTTLKSLKSEDNEIDLVCFTENEDDAKKNEKEICNICSSVRQIPLKLTTSVNKGYMIGVALRSLVSKYSFGLLKYITPAFMQYLNKLKDTKDYDCVYFDHLQMCVYYDQTKLLWPKAKYILDEHNCEFLIMQRNASNSSNILKKMFLLMETAKLRKFESMYLSKFDEVIVLSKEDDTLLKKIAHSSVKSTIIPIGMHTPAVTKVVNNDDIDSVNILFLGTLSWAPNNDGILWFVENVVPKLQQKNIDFKLTIVGKNPGEQLKSAAERLDSVEVVGYVESVNPYYESCDFMIVPLFVGSGQRVKIIEGFSFGMPIISTSIGAEGLQYSDGENILIANTVDTFIEKILMMKKGKVRHKLSVNAKTIFSENYSLEAVKKKICNVIE